MSTHSILSGQSILENKWGISSIQEQKSEFVLRLWVIPTHGKKILYQIEKNEGSCWKLKKFVFGKIRSRRKIKCISRSEELDKLIQRTNLYVYPEQLKSDESNNLILVKDPLLYFLCTKNKDQYHSVTYSSPELRDKKFPNSTVFKEIIEFIRNIE